MPLFAKLFRIGSTRLYRGLTCCLQVRALNEDVEGSVRTVLKPWDQRLDFTTNLESNEDDPELLVFIPYVYINSLMDKWRTKFKSGLSSAQDNSTFVHEVVFLEMVHRAR
jgi:hypothetical protein